MFTAPRDEKQPFAPLERLFADPAAEVRAASADLQLATVIAFLVDERAELLAAVIRGVSETSPVHAILCAEGTDLNELDAAWWAWGQRASRGAAGGRRCSRSRPSCADPDMLRP